MSDSFSYAVLGKAMEVHRELGPGVDEIFYHELLSERLRASGIEHLFRPREQLLHRGIVADIFEADLVFPSRMIAELKCLRGTFEPEHYVPLICYLKFWSVSTGLLCLTQPTADVLVEQRRLGETRCDCLVVGQRFGVQVLALRRSIAAADIAIRRTYLRLLELPHGLILNFGKASLEHCWIHSSHVNPVIPKNSDGQR
jgi:GxxExxY protein